jgi:hypothetical protein
MIGMASAPELRTSQETSGGSRETEHRTARAIREAANSGNGAGVRGLASDFSTQTAEVSAQMTDAIMASAKDVAATINQKLVAATYDQTRKLLDEATRASTVYQDATMGTASGLKALLKSYTDFTLGLNRLPHTYVDTLSRAAGRDGRRMPHDLFQCRSVSDVAALQADLYRDAVSDVIEVSTAILQQMGQATRDAMKPLQPKA